MSKFYVTAAGEYLGSWRSSPPPGSIEVLGPPRDPRQVYDHDAGEYLPLGTAVDEIVLEAESEIDSVCDEAYTSSASRNARYRQKHEEAISYRSAGYPALPDGAEYPYLYQEAGKRGITCQELADLVIQRATAFGALGAIAEAARAELQGIGSKPDPQAAADAIVQGVKDIAGV